MEFWFGSNSWREQDMEKSIYNQWEQTLIKKCSWGLVLPILSDITICLFTWTCSALSNISKENIVC